MQRHSDATGFLTVSSDATDGLISIAAAAKAIGINKSTLSRQVKSGAVRSHDGEVRLSEVISDRAKNVDGAKAHRRRPRAEAHDGGVEPVSSKPPIEPVASMQRQAVASSDATETDATPPDATPNGSGGDLISIAAAAKAVGINKSTLSRQVLTGSVRSHDGKVRLTEVLEDRAKNIDLTKSRSRRKLAASDESDGDAELFGEMEVLVDGKYLAFSKAQQLKENYLARLRQLEFQKKSRLVVDLEATEKLFFATTRELRDAWLGWPPRIATQLAAELGIDERLLAEGLTRYVQQHLAELGEPEAPEFPTAA